MYRWGIIFLAWNEAVIPFLHRNWRYESIFVKCLSPSQILCQQIHSWQRKWLWSHRIVTWAEASVINWEVKGTRKVMEELQLAHSNRKPCISFVFLHINTNVAASNNTQVSFQSFSGIVAWPGLATSSACLIGYHQDVGWAAFSLEAGLWRRLLLRSHGSLTEFTFLLL